MNTRADGARAWEPGGFDVKVRQVCRGCNNGWMSELENYSKSLVSDLATGSRNAELTHAEQTKLAAWLYKTAIMLALAYPSENRYVPREDYRFFFRHRKPPDGTTIFIAAIAPETHDRARTQIGWAAPERLDFHRSDGTLMDAHGYRISLSIFSLISQVLRDPNRGTFARPRRFADAWTCILPLSEGRWPPGLFFDAAGLEDIAGGRILSGAEPPPETEDHGLPPVKGDT